MPERARLLGGAHKCCTRTFIQAGRPALLSCRPRSEALLRRLLADAEDAADLAPAAPRSPGDADEMVEELVGALADAVGSVDGRAKLLERSRVRLLRPNGVDEVGNVEVHASSSLR
jgi:hypothetical protein